MSAPTKIGVIGLGEVGRHQVDGVLAAPGAVLAAVADLDPALLTETAARTGARGFGSADSLIAEADVDAVVVCVPHKYHAALCQTALRRGLHVLVEKPATVTMAEADELIDLADRSGVRLAASHNQLFYPPHNWLRNSIAEGTLPRPTILRLRTAIGGKLGGWRADPALTGGGLLFDAGFHRFYVARFIMGEVSAVSAVLDTPDPRGVGEDAGIVILEFRDGGMAVIEAGYHAPKGTFDDTVEAVTRDALVRIPGLEAHFEKFSAEPEIMLHRDGRWTDVPVEVVTWPQTIHRSVANFVAGIRGEAALAADAREARRIVEIAETVYRSAQEGRRIEV